jgi:ubiquinone/menaquinone biosynthesis C-methylase UbiE
MAFRFSFDHFDWIAPIYDRLIPGSNIELLIHHGNFPCDGKVLDVGGGTGRVTRELLNIQPNVILVDSSLGMLRVANQNLRINLTLCMAEKLPFLSDSFERVILIDTLHHVLDASIALKECLRVLKDDGLLIIQEPDIEQWGGKLIALFEKLLLMRSHLLSIKEVQNFLVPFAKEIMVERGYQQYWIVCRK